MEEPPSLPQTLPPQSNSKELQCVGRLEIARPKPVGFLCGSIPVPTDKSFQDADFNSALVPSARTVTAPRYRVLPTETDLNRPPLLPNFPEKVLPIGAIQNKATGDPFWEGGAIASNLSRKCEALAVSGLVEYGDEIDVIAPTDILKQIFKIPYSKARLSISVRRVGQTLVLNTGADIEEGERLVRRHGNQSKCADQSLFLNFAMHSVRMEACDCPPTHHAQSERQSNSSVLPGTESSTFIGRSDDVARKKGSGNLSEYPHVQQDNSIWESKKNKRNKSHDPVKKASHVGEKPRSSIQESEKQRRFGNDGFLRVLFWKFHNFRMLLGSDLLLFSNEKYVAVSLHLWDVTRQVTPLTWLEAWLDNVMASAPELAICYHENGVVQGYELLKTDDIFLLKGVSDDGAPAFHPHVVQQNGLSVLRFLQENCKQDPGAYWLYKGAGEDVIRLFDLSVISKNHASSACDDGTSSVPLIHRGRSDSLFSLGTLLYRIAHKHSLSLASDNRAKCARFIKQCLDFLDEPDQLVVRALAHEQFARLILNYEEDLIITPEFLPVECEITVTDAEEESVDTFSDFSESAVREKEPLIVKDHFSEAVTAIEDIVSETSVKMTSEENISISKRLVASSDTELRVHEKDISTYNTDESIEVCRMSPTSTNVIETVVDPISAKLTAVHHVSQAIKSLRFMRQLQSSESEYINQGVRIEDMSPYPNFSVCACGDADCIEVCDIREWLPTSKLDNKLWKLVLLLGESYLALGQAYKENCQLHQVLKTVEKACSVYGSMPQHLEDTKFISSMITGLSSPIPANERSKRTRPLIGDMQEVKSSPNDECLNSEKLSSTYLFWARAWTLVGDVYVEFHMMKGKEISIQAERKPSTRELKMSPEVEKEVQRLKRKLGQYQNCRSCSLVNCSCQSDRASSGSSASSSSENKVSIAYGRKHNKRSHAKSSSYSLLEDTADSSVNCKDENKKCHDSGNLQLNRGGSMLLGASNIDSEKLVESLDGIKSKRVEGSMKPQNEESTGPTQTEIASREEPKMKSGGIFRFLGGSVVGDAENNLSAALSCYEEAIKALSGLPTVSAELQSVQKKKGWVCNEMGRIRLEKKELQKAEFAFANAISAFKEVSDHINIILINCNLGHGRRSLAEEMVSKIESLKVHAILQNVYKQALETAKLEYRESIRYYGAAKLQLNSLVEDGGSLSDSLRMEVHTQFAHTYLRLGMLLAREDTTAEVYEIGAWEDLHVLCDGKTRKEMRKHEITANDSIREALSFYESMGDLRKQEAAFAYFQLACYQRDCCLKYLEVDHKKNNLPKGENSVVQRVKQYASLAERNWQRAIDFYSPRSHATMYLTILLERSTLLFSLSCSLHSNVMLETALSCLLEGCHIPESCSEFLTVDGSEVCAKFWKQLQMLLKRMLVTTASASPNKCHTPGQSISPIRYADAGKLRELYKMSLKSTNFISALQAMHTLWT